MFRAAPERTLIEAAEFLSRVRLWTGKFRIRSNHSSQTSFREVRTVRKCPRVRFPVRTVAFAVRYPVRSGIRVAVSLHGYCSVLVLPLYRSDTAFLRA